MNGKYENGKIYRIVCNTSSKYYIGSTIKTIKERLSSHKQDFKMYLNDKNSYTSSFDILENNNYIIELVEEYPCSNNTELRQREDIYIKKYMNDEFCVNKNRSYITDEERRENMKKYNKKYNKIYKKEYNKKNQDKIRERRKKNDKKNQDKIRERRKQRYTCLCGLNIRRCDIRRHLKSKIHHTTLLHLVKKKCSDIL